MMRTILCVLLILASGPPQAIPDTEAPFDVHVALQIDRTIASKVVLSQLCDETAAVWAPYNVRISCVDAPVDAGFRLDAFLTHRILPERLRDDALVLGLAYVDLRGPTRVPIRMSFDATERVLALRPHAAAATTRFIHEGEVTRALGRVLAHEVGHVLLGASHHDETGLMRAVFSPDQLAQLDRRPFELTTGSVGRLRSRIERFRAVPADVSAPLSDVTRH